MVSSFTVLRLQRVRMRKKKPTWLFLFMIHYWPTWDSLCQAFWVEFSWSFHQELGCCHSHFAHFACPCCPSAGAVLVGRCWEVLGAEGMTAAVWRARVSFVTAGCSFACAHEVSPGSYCGPRTKKPNTFSKPSLSLLLQQEVAFPLASFCSKKASL